MRDLEDRLITMVNYQDHEIKKAKALFDEYQLVTNRERELMRFAYAEGVKHQCDLILQDMFEEKDLALK